MRIFRKLAQMLDLDETNKTAGYSVVVNATGDGYELSDVSGGGGGSDNQTAAEVPFTPAGTIAATDTQSAVEEVATDAAAAVSALSAVYQPLDSDLTSIAALSTTAYGRAFLAFANEAAFKAGTNLEAGTDFPSQTTFDDHSARHEDGGADEISIAGLAGTSVALQSHLDDTADAHDASAVSVLDAATNFTGTDVEAVLAELQDNIDNASGTGAPTDATYIVQTANGSLSAEQALGALATGILKNTTTTGVLSIATANTDYAAATHATRHENGGADEISIAGLDGTPVELTNHLNDTSAAHAASAISASSTTLVGTGTDVQAVLEELDNGIADHLADATAAHAASAISFSPTGTIAATDVQAAIAEVASEAGGGGTSPDDVSLIVHMEVFA